jgi:hypothetical protein
VSSSLCQANKLRVGDVLLLPFERTATVERIGPIGPRSQFIRFKTEHGWTRLLLTELVLVQVEPKVESHTRYVEFSHTLTDVLYSLNRAISAVPDGCDVTVEMLLSMQNHLWDLIKAFDPSRVD